MLGLVAALPVAGLGACHSEPDTRLVLKKERALRVPAADVGHVCVDVAGPTPTRACYARDSAGPIKVFSAAEPPFAARSEMGWRCVGFGGERRCYDRAEGAGRFECEGDRCIQLYPRVPDANEWTCSDASGAALCLLGERAAGVALGRRTPGYLCGSRKIAGNPSKAELCLDLAPDFPDGNSGAWSCHYEGQPTPRRVCVKRATLALGAACKTNQGCPAGAVCASGRCLPRTLAPNCWLDSDCQGGRCRLGSCQ